MKLRQLVGLFLALAMIATACGSGSDGDSDSTATDTGSSDTADTSADADEPAAPAAGIDLDAIMGADLDNCAAAPSGDAIKVGMVMDFSEAAGFVDIPGSKLVPYVAELANCAGGINGQPVEVRGLGVNAVMLVVFGGAELEA